MSPRTVATFLLLSALLGPHASAQSGEQPLKFKSKVNLVLVPTIVSDKSGKHVRGLKAEDFVVLENGVEQKLAVVEEISTTNERTAETELPAGRFSNHARAFTGPVPHRLTIIVFDLINTPTLRRAKMRRELLRFLGEVGNTGELTAVYRLALDGVQCISPFTADPKLLADAVKRIDSRQGIVGRRSNEATPHEGAQPSASATQGGFYVPSAGTQGRSQIIQAQLEQMMQELNENFESFQQRVTATYTLEGLQEIASAVAGIPGRKSLIWVTGGFPFEISINRPDALFPSGRSGLSDVLPLYQHTWQSLNNAQIAMYPVGALGVVNEQFTSAALGRPETRLQDQMAWEHQQGINTLKSFADATGGRAYYNSDDLKSGFAEAANDSKNYYLLAYYPSRAVEAKASWHTMTVKTKIPGVNIRARKEYFYPGDLSKDQESLRNSDFAAALRSPIELTELPLTAEWGATTADSGKKRVAFTLGIRPELEADSTSAVLEIAAVANPLKGEPAKQSKTVVMTVPVTDGNRAQIASQGVAYSRYLEVAPGDYNVYFVVRDATSGRVGSIIAPLHVEP